MYYPNTYQGRLQPGSSFCFAYTPYIITEMRREDKEQAPEAPKPVLHNERFMNKK